jgi:hypothetical protein
MLLVVAAIQSSCAEINSTKIEYIKQKISFVGCQNDLLSGQPRIPKVDLNTHRFNNGKVEKVTFPLCYFVTCNATKTNCKHAVVKTQLNIATQYINEHSLKVFGVLHSEMGRSLTMETNSPSGFSQKFTLSVPNDVPVVGVSNSNIQIEKFLSYGETLELDGMAGVKVFVEYIH